MFFRIHKSRIVDWIPNDFYYSIMITQDVQAIILLKVKANLSYITLREIQLILVVLLINTIIRLHKIICNSQRQNTANDCGAVRHKTLPPPPTSQREISAPAVYTVDQHHDSVVQGTDSVNVNRTENFLSSPGIEPAADRQPATSLISSPCLRPQSHDRVEPSSMSGAIRASSWDEDRQG